MVTLHLKANEQVMQKILANLNSLAEAGNEIEILEAESHAQDSSWDDILQNEQVMQDLRESIEQAKNGKFLSEEDTFKKLYEELNL